jgi:tRNA-Thr(GGU) m(6)t(6)A37 methyltransferase TsaA
MEITDMEITLRPIGYVRTARAEAVDDFWGEEIARVELEARYGADALEGISAFSHAEVIFLFHQVDEAKIVTGARHPRNNLAWPKVGIFAQRGKNRPNRIGSTICRIVRVEGNSLLVSELDAIDGTPVLDIKPVMREFLPRSEVRQADWVAELMADYWSPARR